MFVYLHKSEQIDLYDFFLYQHFLDNISSSDDNCTLTHMGFHATMPIIGKPAIRLAAALLCTAVTAAALPIVPASVQAADTYQIRDKWGYCTTANYVTSEHFCIFYGNNDTTGHVNEEFLQRNLNDLERLWEFYTSVLGMTNINVDIYGNSSTLYKTNVYLTETGLDQYPDGWAFMSAEDGYGIHIISPSAMLDDLTIAHEFGHVVTMHQKAWVDQDITGAWWEAAANWFREMYLASDYYQGSVQTCWFEPYIRNMSLTLPHGRSYYEVWPFLVYLSYNPDNLPNLGIHAVQQMMSQALPGEYPFDTITRLFGTEAQTVLGHYAKRMATFDFGNQAAYQNEFNNKVASSPFYWNLFYTVLEETPSGRLQVGQEEAPMQTGINIVPLQITDSSISVDFHGLSNDPNAGWQACIVTVDSAGNETYSDLFGDGQSMTVSTDGAVSAYLTVVGTPKDLYDINAFHKDAVSSYKTGTERARYPYEIQLTGATVQQIGGYTKGAGHLHANGGGFVADSATVADSVYVGPNAMVLGNANLSGNVRVEDYAIVANSVTATDSAVISGHAVVDGGGMIYDNDWVFGSVTLSGNAVVSDHAVVTNSCKISGNARILQKAYLADAVTDNAVVKGTSYLYGKGNYSGQVILDGDYANEETLSSGIGFGWLDTVNSCYTDGMISGYSFDSETSHWVLDRHGATNAQQVGAMWQADRTSAADVLSFDGTNDYLLLDDSILNTQNLQISLAALWKGGTAEQTLFRFGDDDAYLKFTPPNANGVAEFTITDGTTLQTLTANAPLNKGVWSKITIRLIDGTGTLLIDGQTAATAAISCTPISVLSAAQSDVCTLGKGGNDTAAFKGAVDYVNFYFRYADEPTMTYSGQEEIDDTDSGNVTTEVTWGDVDTNGIVNVADAVLLCRYVAEDNAVGVSDQGQANADCAYDAVLDSKDSSMIMQYLANLVPYEALGQ